MSRKWFDRYLTSPVFLTAKYFFTSNRVEKFPGDDMELTILDYLIWDATKRLHFQVCPLWSNHYERRNLFFSRGSPTRLTSSISVRFKGSETLASLFKRGRAFARPSRWPDILDGTARYHQS